ncbi:nucleotide exchange factor GrpE [Planococcus maritimus]|uniref:nucleotide exchange factor GrpE n=1 Tax=Planococcus maritimus TaxID=192421 RepID=UPI0007954109|nr:nucleotide exchange factor GrpE [Planococcus maritimus]KYG58019.1 nucleotide exchange factor GrpE [Planococcus maritimus]OED32233.1 nucleotide exchange factor GrpE [Planococcus maritimus]
MSNEKETIKQQDLEQDAAQQEKQDAVDQTAETVDAEPATAESAEQAQADEPVDEKAELQAQLEEEQNKYLRLLADYDNFKRRAKKDQELAKQFRSQSLLTDLLPVLDNFDRALAVEAKSEESASLLKGLEMVKKSLTDAVTSEGLEEIKAVGEPFDPHFHQAVMQESDADSEPGTVLQELQKGYTLNGRVLRPAMVKVNE